MQLHDIYLVFLETSVKEETRVKTHGRTSNRGLIIEDGYGNDNLKVQVLNYQELESAKNTQRL